ncbi:NADH-quinone oxidoreductase subunit E [Maritimibacter sp. DP1N21-5]|uniref:NADH-quinone oxidoreductase subunit E n=1 Tax=Maritimibacter sp. DP1N21-5 TaxID=2836867 RepID=UPI001C446938|nr:NADH-quinone oxidoreductase subunit E [Maritimibacter sp. DP1N21-5]MBV7409448.1 NADH-quinone oxidoreductase subunit E [Maritimibacter sp. DP1N21-5]
MLRRLHHEQPASFAFTPDNLAWAEAQITKYPEGRQASAIIPLLWRAQEQEGWLTRPAIESIADMLGMQYIRALEVATFYFMFQLQPVGSVAHFQICGTTSCMIMGSEDLIAVCKERIAPKAHQLSADGKFSWEEVECLGSCANAPMAQIGKDYYEDLTTESFGALIDKMAAGEVPVPGPQNGRYTSEPAHGLTSLKDHEAGKPKYNASVELATDIGDTLKRIDGTEVPLRAPWQGSQTGKKVAVKPRKAVTKPGDAEAAMSDANEPGHPEPKANAKPAATTSAGAAKTTTGAAEAAKAKSGGDAPAMTDAPVNIAGGDAPQASGTPAAEVGTKPAALDAPREGKADDLKAIKGVGPKLETMLHGMGFYHFDQIAAWSADELAWVDQNLEGFKGRASRDNWTEQAKTLASGGETEFSKKVKKGDVY